MWQLGMWMLATPMAAPALPLCELGPAAVYVLTAAPGESPQSHFGHTAVLLWDPEAGGRSVVYDYGAYRAAPWWELMPKLLTQRLAYEQDTEPVARFRKRYLARDRTVVAQRLSLAPAEMIALRTRLQQDALHPEFDYHWFDENCTTKVRDLLLDEALYGGASGRSVRGEVLRHTAPTRWLWLGLSWGTVERATAELTQWEAMFLPENLQRTLEEAGMVDDTCTFVPSDGAGVRAEAPRWGSWLWLLGLKVAAVLTLLAWASPRIGRAAVAVVGTAGGLFGTAALLVTVLGTFAPAWDGYNLWLVSPAWLLLPVAAVWRGRAPQAMGPSVIAGGLLALVACGVVYGAVRGLLGTNAAMLGLFAPTLVVAAWALRRLP